MKLVNEDLKKILKAKSEKDIEKDAINSKNPFDLWYMEFVKHILKIPNLEYYLNTEEDDDFNVYDYFDYYKPFWKEEFFDKSFLPIEAAKVFIDGINLNNDVIYESFKDILTPKDIDDKIESINVSVFAFNKDRFYNLIKKYNLKISKSESYFNVIGKTLILLKFIKDFYRLEDDQWNIVTDIYKNCKNRAEKMNEGINDLLKPKKVPQGEIEEFINKVKTKFDYFYDELEFIDHIENNKYERYSYLYDRVFGYFINLPTIIRDNKELGKEFNKLTDSISAKRESNPPYK